MQTKYIILSIVISVLLLAFNIYVLDMESSISSPDDKYKPTKSSGKAMIGGHFQLTDVNDNPFDSSTLNGKKAMIYFGFTHCPMVCPTAVSNMTMIMNELPAPLAEQIIPVFISVDPDRDTPQVIKEYLEPFYPSFIGLTGDKEQVEQIKELFKVYAKKAPLGDEPISDEVYDMQHSSIIYIMNENGEYESHFTHETSVSKALEQILRLFE